MDEMTEAQYKEAHIALWDWLFHHPSKEKYNWPGWEHNGGGYGEVFGDCFACECSARDNGGTERNCLFCPLKKEACLDAPSIYDHWVKISDPKVRKKYAAIIRDAWREVPV
jgi:hypothetical protein